MTVKRKVECWFKCSFLVARRVPYWWKRGCFITNFGNFSTRGENIIFTWMEATQGGFKHARWDETNIKMNMSGGRQEWGQMGAEARWEAGVDQIGVGARWGLGWDQTGTGAKWGYGWQDGSRGQMGWNSSLLNIISFIPKIKDYVRTSVILCTVQPCMTLMFVNFFLHKWAKLANCGIDKPGA